MSNSGLDLMTGGHSGPGRRRASRPKRKPWGKAQSFLGGPEDYSGQGTGSVTIEIPKGANGQQIADILAKKDVVKSAEAFYQLALKDSRFQSIQAGFYKLR